MLIRIRNRDKSAALVPLALSNTWSVWLDSWQCGKSIDGKGVEGGKRGGGEAIMLNYHSSNSSGKPQPNRAVAAYLFKLPVKSRVVYDQIPLKLIKQLIRRI